MVSSTKLEIVSQEHNEVERPKESSLPESSEISLNSNQSNDSFLDIMTKDNEIINIENETINSSSPTLTSHNSCPSTQQQQSFSRNHDNFLNVHNTDTSQNIQPTQGPTPAATPTQKLSPRLSISEQNISQSNPELRSLLYSHQHLPLQQQQYLEQIFAEDQYRLQQMIQSQASLGQMVSTSYCPQQHQQYQMLADCGQVQIDETSATFLQPYQPQSSNSHSVLRHQNNVQRKSQPISESERQRRRLERNRVAARQCRERKKVYVSNLESKVARLEEENAKLRSEVLKLSAKLLQNPVDVQDNQRLYTLTEELKARLYAQEQQYRQSNLHSLQEQQQQGQEQQQKQERRQKQKSQQQQQQQQHVNKEDATAKDKE